MVRIANEKNVDQLLAELKEYALEVDVDFVRRAVKAIGQAAIKIDAASEKCVNVLLELIATKVNYVVQEAVVVIKDIFRRYPGYEGIIPTLCKCIDDLDEPNARGSLIWIVGEYAEKINNADEILSGFVEGFLEEFTQVCFMKGFLDEYEAVILTCFRCNYKSLQQLSSSSLRSRINRRDLSRRFYSRLQRRMITLIFEIERTYTGDYYQVILKLPR
jgi:vesicle coat complex subunit